MNRGHATHRHALHGLLLFVIGVGLLLYALGVIHTGAVYLLFILAFAAMIRGTLHMYEGYHESSTRTHHGRTMHHMGHHREHREGGAIQKRRRPVRRTTNREAGSAANSTPTTGARREQARRSPARNKQNA